MGIGIAVFEKKFELELLNLKNWLEKPKKTILKAIRNQKITNLRITYK
jgi:hypothetical protein